MTARPDTLERLSRTIDEAASADIADLVAEARLEARTKVRAILAEAIAERLLDLAETELGHRVSAPGAAKHRSEGGATRLGGDATGDRAHPHRTTRASDAADDLARRAAASERHTGPGCRAAGPVAPERGPAETQDGPGETQDVETPDVAYYVYGVVRANAELEPGLTGVDGIHDVFLVLGQAVAAVVSAVPLDEFSERALREHLEDLAWVERRAHRHEHVLDRVRQQATLVPMRLCTIYRDEQSVREMLAREHEFLADALERLAGRTEWGVKLYAVADDPSQTIALDLAEREEPVDGSGSGASYLNEKQLQERRRERIDAAVEEHCRYAHLELARAAVEAKLNPIQPRELTHRDEPMVLNGVYLVDDAAFDGFASTVARVRSDLAEVALEPELTGPWPPYNFVGSPVEVGR